MGTRLERTGPTGTGLMGTRLMGTGLTGTRLTGMRLAFKGAALLFLLVSLTAWGMPASFYQALARMDTSSYLCVKNYDAGASVTESYTNFDHLEKETEITSQSFHPSNSSNDSSRGYATLDASISSTFTGRAHIAWQSREVNPGLYGRHVAYGLMQEDLIGTWSMERLIHLSSNNSRFTRQDWLACS
ncbi:MAG: hypothetical protein ACOX84_06915 [Methanothrix sp.]